MSSNKVEELVRKAPAVLAQRDKFLKEVEQALERLEQVQTVMQERFSVDVFHEKAAAAVEDVVKAGKYDSELEKHANNPGLISIFEKVIALIDKKTAYCEAKIEEDELVRKTQEALLQQANKRKADAMAAEDALMEIAAARHLAAMEKNGNSADVPPEEDADDHMEISEVTTEAMDVEAGDAAKQKGAEENAQALKKRKIDTPASILKDIRIQADKEAEQELKKHVIQAM